MFELGAGDGKSLEEKRDMKIGFLSLKPVWMDAVSACQQGR